MVILIALIVLILTGTVLSLVLAYLVFWTLAWFCCRDYDRRFPALPRLRFALVVPAHNEEDNLHRTIDSLKALDYPPELFQIVIVADNCSDSTAEVARGAKVRCLVRHDPFQRGKGYALKYAFERLLPEKFAAFVIVDADTEVEPNLLRVMNDRLLGGEKVLQVCYGMTNPDAGPLSYVFHVGNVLENRFFYEAKARLGFPAVLRGNGMCLAREVLAQVPWDAFSVTEDSEYTIRLLQQGIHIEFIADTAVRARQPERLSQARGQRVRWSSGNFKVVRERAWALLGQGWRQGNTALVDAALAFITLSKPLLIGGIVLFSGASILLYALAPEAGYPLVVWSLVLLGLLLFYGLTGIIQAGVSVRRLVYLLLAPFYVAWLMGIAALGLAGYRQNLWTRTSRT